MVATFGSLQTKVSTKLIDSNQTAIKPSDVADALNDALHYWKQKQFWFNQAQTKLTMDINDPYILGYGNTVTAYPLAPVLPANFLYEIPHDGFVIPYSNISYRFTKVQPAQFDDISNNGVGLPYIYTFRNGNYEFCWAPNLAYTMIVNYTMDVSDLVNLQDTNIFTKYADRLLMYEALSHLYAENRQDQQSGAMYAQRAKQEYDLLTTRGNNQVATGRLSVNTILQ